MFLKNSDKKFILLASALPILFMPLAFYTPAEDTLSLAMITLFIGIITLFRWTSNNTKALHECSVLIAGLLYVPLLLIIVTYLTPYEMLFSFLLPAVNDTFAYAVGLTVGKHKIWEAVSPKKSIEGSIGGMIASAMFTILFCGFFGDVAWYYALPLGIALSIMAQLGDFFESALKRTANVKDSSNLLPGHGGVLDRLDSILFVVPTLMFLLSIFPQLRF